MYFLSEIKYDLMTIEEGEHGYFRSRPYTESDDVIKIINYISENFDECDPFQDGNNYEDFIYDDYRADEIEEDFDRCMNSYNWNGPVIFQIRPFTMNGREFTAIAFHRFGDVRCNYTKYACFEMDRDEFVQKLMDFQLEIPCENWHITQDLFEEDGYIHACDYDHDQYFDGWYEDANCPEEITKAVNDAR